MKNNLLRQAGRSGALLALCTLCSCGTMGKLVNPYYEPPAPIAQQGEANDHALNGTMQKEDTARKSLEQMASYERANTPSPDKPVVRPSVVRLMWIPDHLNRNGDLVPAHYYYLKVLQDRWAASDAFEIEQQLGKNGDASNIPYVMEGDITKNE